MENNKLHYLMKIVGIVGFIWLVTHGFIKPAILLLFVTLLIV